MPGVYANTTWWENYLTDPCFERWSRWVAQYYSRCEYGGTYDIWQCTSVATIKGISGSNNVDLNFDFRANWGVKGAWEKSGSTWKYRYDDGTYASGSLVDIDGAIYTFNSSGNALRGWQKVSGSWRYFDPDTRAMVRGWLEYDGIWYWLDTTSGAMATGWALVGDTWYYFDAEGHMKDAEIFKVDGVSYIAAEGGACPAEVLLRPRHLRDEGGGDLHGERHHVYRQGVRCGERRLEQLEQLVKLQHDGQGRLGAIGQPLVVPQLRQHLPRKRVQDHRQVDVLV